jgi:hypothetical protein
MTLRQIRELAATDKFDLALRELETLVQSNKECACLWLLRGDLIQLSSGEAFELKDAEESYRKAHELNPNALEALESLAHFYDIVDPKPLEARKYALTCLDKAQKLVQDMEQIVQDSEREEDAL